MSLEAFDDSFIGHHVELFNCHCMRIVENDGFVAVVEAMCVMVDEDLAEAAVCV